MPLRRKSSMTMLSKLSGPAASAVRNKARTYIARHRQFRVTSQKARRKPGGRAHAQFVAGAAGGGVATYSTHWLDTVKVRMQTSPGEYTSGTRCLRETVRQEGVRQLYRGATPAVLGNMAKASVVFTSYGVCQNLVQGLCGCDNREDLTIAQHASAGAMTAVTASFVLCPLEVIKCRMQACQQAAGSGNTPQKCGPVAVLKTTVRTEGAAGLYRGITGIWTKEIPGSFIYFGSYESARKLMRSLLHKDTLDSKATFVCGLAAGMAFCCLHPIESVKTRVQVALPSTEVAGSQSRGLTRSSGFFKACVHILKTEGMRPLWSGLGPCMARACLFSGIQFTVYETVRQKIIEEGSRT